MIRYFIGLNTFCTCYYFYTPVGRCSSKTYGTKRSGFECHPRQTFVTQHDVINTCRQTVSVLGILRNNI